MSLSDTEKLQQLEAMCQRMREGRFENVSGQLCPTGLTPDSKASASFARRSVALQPAYDTCCKLHL